MKFIFIIILALSFGVLTSCGGGVETFENRDPISRLWIPVKENSVDLYFNNIFLNVKDVPIPFYDGLGVLSCTCQGFFTGSPTKGTYEMECPNTCNTTFTQFVTDNGTYEVSDTNIMTICPEALRVDLCIEYK